MAAVGVSVAPPAAPQLVADAGAPGTHSNAMAAAAAQLQKEHNFLDLAPRPSDTQLRVSSPFF